MATIQERYNPIVVGANSTVTIHGDNVGCFLCTTSGTVTLVSNAHDGKAQTTLLSAFAVTQGTFYRLPFYLGRNGGTFTTAGGATGLLGV